MLLVVSMQTSDTCLRCLMGEHLLERVMGVWHFLSSIFQSFVCFRSHVSNFLSAQDPISSSICSMSKFFHVFAIGH